MYLTLSLDNQKPEFIILYYLCWGLFYRKLIHRSSKGNCWNIWYRKPPNCSQFIMISFALIFHTICNVCFLDQQKWSNCSNSRTCAQPLSHPLIFLFDNQRINVTSYTLKSVRITCKFPKLFKNQNGLTATSTWLHL